jgi:glutamate synthase (NADPH/NADH) small chain
MGKPTGFLEIERLVPARRPPEERLKDFAEFEAPMDDAVARDQGARCMNCGIPFCHDGCPLGNVIPDFNDLVYHGRWEDAAASLASTNNFPEITGRICPAPCEEACVLNINDDPVTIKRIEREVGDRALAAGGATPRPPARETGKRVAVVGSGPAGLACAQQLRRAGHAVEVLERDDRIGGLLVYGIPDFKLDKSLIERRVEQMRGEGVTFRTGVEVGEDVTLEALREANDAVVLAIGSTRPRDLPIEGRELDGVCFAMDFLTQQNRVVAGDEVEGQILATGKHVVILGGGDTGSDCLGTSLRQGAASVHQIELMPKPPESREEVMAWPDWPMILRTSSSQEEGGEREWSILTKRFEGEGGELKRLVAVRVEWEGRELREVEGSEMTIEADLCLLAMGFVGHELEGVDLGAELGSYRTSMDGVYSCGDARRGQSLVVWAIWEGREAARRVDEDLMGRSLLPASPRNIAQPRP